MSAPATKFLEALMTATLDLFENIFPSAISQAQWCEAGVREAFATAKFVQDTILKIDSLYAELLYAQIAKSCQLVNLSPCLRDDSYLSYTTIPERLDIAFEINPYLSRHFKELTHVYFLQTFGQVPSDRSAFYAQLLLRHYTSNQSSSQGQLHHVLPSILQHVKYQLSLTQGLQRHKTIQKILQSISLRSCTLDEARFVHTSILVMLGHPECDFASDVVMTLRRELARTDVWDPELLDFYFLDADPVLLRSAMSTLEKNGITALTVLLIDIVNSYASIARRKITKIDPVKRYLNPDYDVHKSVTVRWTLDGVHFNFKQWRNIVQIAARDVFRSGKNAFEQQLLSVSQTARKFNHDFWEDLLLS